MAGLDPTLLDFDFLPSCFDLDNPMSHPSGKQAVKITFREFVDDHPDFVGILLQCLACVVHHKDNLTAQTHQLLGHNWNNLIVLQEADLVFGNCKN